MNNYQLSCPLETASVSMGAKTFNGAVSCSALHACIRTGKAADGAEVSLGKLGWGSQGTLVVGRVSSIGARLFQQLSKVFSESHFEPLLSAFASLLPALERLLELGHFFAHN
jgi:hypothetical protein